MRRARSQSGFTLIEVVGAFFMTVLILWFVTGIFVENGRQREAAAALMSERLSTVAALDVLAADLAGAMLLKRGEEDDPEAHPWRFVASAPGDFGATSVRFVTQAGPRANPATGSSAWNEVAYFLAEEEDGERVLWRWVSPRPPEEASREFPQAGDPGTMRVALGVAEFGLRFMDGEGTWGDEWDSTFLGPEQGLPEAAEISLRLMRRVRPGESPDDPEAIEVPGALLHSRRVAFTMRPLDVEALIALGQAGGDEAADCLTIDQCLAKGESSWYQELLAGGCGGDDRLCETLRDSAKVCWSTIQTTYPAIAARAPAECAK